MASFLVKSSAVDDGFCGMVDRRKTSSLIPCQDHCQRPLSEILTITNLRYTVNRIWTCAEPEFRLGWMELCSSDNHYTTAPCYSKFTRKHLCRSHFFFKNCWLKNCNFTKTWFQRRYFPVYIAKFYRRNSGEC